MVERCASTSGVMRIQRVIGMQVSAAERSDYGVILVICSTNEAFSIYYSTF